VGDHYTGSLPRVKSDPISRTHTHGGYNVYNVKCYTFAGSTHECYTASTTNKIYNKVNKLKRNKYDNTNNYYRRCRRLCTRALCELTGHGTYQLQDHQQTTHEQYQQMGQEKEQ